MNNILILIMMFLFAGCSSMQVSNLDPQTKRFPTQNKAIVLTSKKINLDNHNALLLMPEDTFLRGQMANIHYFTEIITPDQLKMQIIRKGLADEVPSLSDAYGINKAAKAYKPFLWFRLNKRINLDGYYGQFILTNPKTFEDYFIAEIKLENSIKGTGDIKVWYPLFNALIDYIEQNSKSWDMITNKVSPPKKEKPTLTEFFSSLGTSIVKDHNTSKESKKTQDLLPKKPSNIEAITAKVPTDKPKVTKKVVQKESEQSPLHSKTPSENNNSVNGVKNLFTALEKLLSKPKSTQTETEKQ